MRSLVGYSPDGPKESDRTEKLTHAHVGLAVLGLHCCMWAFSSCSWQGLLAVVCRLLSAGASLVEEHRR